MTMKNEQDSKSPVIPPLPPATGSVQDVCKWVETELCAGMVLMPNNEADRVWNQAHQRAIGILRKYKRGEGLFQMTAPNS